MYDMLVIGAGFTGWTIVYHIIIECGHIILSMVFTARIQNAFSEHYVKN